jgi:hypothetical protein
MTLEEEYSQQAHNQAAGRYDGLRTATNIINAHVGQLFIDRKDELARKLRDVASEVAEHEERAKADLDTWIRKAMKR